MLNIKTVKNYIVSAFYPERCPYCDAVIAADEYVCDTCKPKLTGTPLTRYAVGGYPCYSVFRYEGAYASAVKRLKFSNRCSYAKPLSFMLVNALAEKNALDFDFITYVPMHKKAEGMRGYNQSKLLAKHCSEVLEIPCLDVLVKTKVTPPQHSLKSEKDREKNVYGVFKETDKTLIQNKKILIIDDIITSGNTLGECCRILIKNGAVRISCATVCSAAIT